MTPPTTDNPKTSPKLTTISQSRDDAWLEATFVTLWETFFSDVEQINTVKVKWGRASRTRLGTIRGTGGSKPRQAPDVSTITINALLQSPLVPESVIIHTMAHEIAHYTHGFCSPHAQKHKHPHRGGVVDRELIDRGLGEVHLQAETWLKANWSAHTSAHLGRAKPIKRRLYATKRRLPVLSYRNARTFIRRRLGK